MIDWVTSLPDWVQALIRVLLFVLPVLLLVPGMIWYERRLLGWMQDRHGPNRTGNITLSRRSKFVPEPLKGKKFRLFGLLQPIADGVKLFIKEDMTPASVDRTIYFIAPAVALFPAFTLGATVPWGPWKELTPVADVNIGVLWILAISALGVYGVVLSGYASNNKYSLLGSLRASAQLISYELGMTMSLASIVLATGSLKLTDIITAQEGPLWGIPGNILANWNILTPYGFVAGVVFFICMVAETNRAPFDLPEAENELVAGYHTEYSSMKFAVFFMGEYAAMFVYGLIFMVVFMGGWHFLPVRWDAIATQFPPLATLANWFNSVDRGLAPLTMVAKGAIVITMYVWLRATMPRLRYDQLMALGWKSLLPLATANLIAVAAWLLVARLYGPVAGIFSLAVSFVLIYLLYRAVNKSADPSDRYLDSRGIDMVDIKVPQAAPVAAAATEEVPA